MGYYTKYKLTWATDLKMSCPHCQGTGKIEMATVIRDSIEQEPVVEHEYPIKTQLEDRVTWYDHERDMKALSCKFPDALFTLEGQGEEAGDVWIKYFKGGKMQVEKLEMKLPKFDPAKLR